MKRLLTIALLTASAVFAQNSQFGGLYRAMAFAYGAQGGPQALQVSTGTTATGAGSIRLTYGRITLNDGTPYMPFATNAPITVGSEVVTPSSVSCSTVTVVDSCMVSATFSQMHYRGESVSSATVGLQEALNAANAKGGGSAMIDGAWAAAGGTSAMVSAAVTYATTVIYDNRTGSNAGSFLQAGTGAVARSFQSKNQDIVSVKDFGATGNGSASDTAAVQSTLTAAGNGYTYLPNGVYRTCGLSVGNVSKVISSGATLKLDPSGCGVTSLALVTQGSGYTTATVSLSTPPAGGTQATATATISGGKITALALVPGSGYVAAPTVTITGDGTGATATAYLAILNVSSGAPLQGNDKMILRDVKVDCENRAGVSGILVGNTANVVFQNVSAAGCPATGVYLHNTQFGSFKDLKVYSNGTGLKIDSDPVSGGGNSNSFYDFQSIGNNLGVWINSVGAFNVNGLYFRNPTVNSNIVGLASYNPAGTFPAQFYWDGGNPEANAQSAMASNVTVDGVTIPRSVLWLQKTDGILDKVSDQDGYSAAPLYIQTAGSNLQMVNNFFPGNYGVQQVTSDSTSAVTFAGTPTVSGLINNATNFPASVLSGASFTVIGPPITKNDNSVPNTFAGNPYTPAVTGGFNATASVATDSQMGQIESIAFTNVVGNQNLNAMRWNAATFTTTEDTLVSALLKSSVTGTFSFGFYGKEGTPITLPAGQWVRVLVAAPSLPSSQNGFINLFPLDTNAATVSVTRLEILQIASGDASLPGYFSTVSATGAFNPNNRNVPNANTITGAATLSLAITFANASGGAFTATLPSAVQFAGQSFTVTKSDSSANALTINSAGGTIGTATTVTLDYSGATVTVNSDGANWQIISASNGISMSGNDLVSIGKNGTFGLQSFASVSDGISSNVYYNGSQNVYRVSNAAAMVQFNSGSILFRTAPGGTAGNTMTLTTGLTLNNNGSVVIGPTGVALTRLAKYTAALTPASVAANTCAEQAFTVTGIAASDIVYGNKPTSQAGLGVSGVRASATNTVGINYCNTTAAAITPTAETYSFGVIQ